VGLETAFVATMKPSVTIVGAGIVGLAMARSFALQGAQVKVYERSPKALGASIRNFGLVWPIAQPQGPLYERALKGRAIWRQLAEQAGFACDAVGSMQLAYRDDEAAVLEEFYGHSRALRSLQLLRADEAKLKTGAVLLPGLKCALLSQDEMVVDPREAIAQIASYLSHEHGVEFVFSAHVAHVESGWVWLANGQKQKSDLTVICSGAEFESLYPQLYPSAGLTKCKLQMMRLAPQPEGWRLGPTLCGGLSLLHYQSFEVAKSLEALRERMTDEWAEYLRYGIHVMVSQNQSGELIVGDSHEYGSDVAPFDSMRINELILQWLDHMVQVPNPQVAQTWHGVYAKSTHGESELVLSPERGVHIVNGLGGAGMTLSFALADELSIKLR
jgi:FAD dependent oxidoreductase TIGR03364